MRQYIISRSKSLLLQVFVPETNGFKNHTVKMFLFLFITAVIKVEEMM